jgi:hypothetical protein
MSQVPTNEKLYAMVVFQAKAKYRVYPSPGASHWVHRRYLELGGKFEDSTEKTYRDKMVKAAVESYKRKKLAHAEDHDKAGRHPKDKKNKKHEDK